MGNTIKQFDYQVIKMKRGDDLPFNPHVELLLQTWSTNDAGCPLISPHLMTDGEIDWHIAALKADLDAVGQRAKAALRKAREHTKALVAARTSE